MGQLPSLAKRSGSRLLFPPRLARLYRLRALESPIHAFRIEPAAARPGLVSQVDDAQDLLRGSVEGDAVRIGGHEIGLAVTLNALVLVPRPLAVEADMRELVLSQLFGEFANRLALEVDLTPTFDVAGIGAGIGCIDAFARGGAQIILGFHVLEIERELENVLVLDVRLVPCPETHRRWHTGLR